MQTEIDTLGWPTPASIIGVNGVGHDSANGLIVNGRSIPWLQDTAEEDVWTAWGVVYRDVVILNQANVPVGVFNLTSHDLSNPDNYDALKTLLREAALTTPTD